MKILPILITAILFLGLGGAGGYFYFEQSAEASFGDADQQALADYKQKQLDKRSAEEKAANLRFVQLEPIVLPIIDEVGVTQVVTLVVSLEVDGDENATFAQNLSPRLKDAFIQDMYGVLNRKASTDGGVIKVDQLKERLTRLSSKVLGAGKINDVLLQVVNQRPI